LLGLDLFLLALVPALRLLVDPLLLLLVFLGFSLRSSRFLWLFGFFLGLLKDLYSSDLFGAWAGTFALTAAGIGATRHLVEWEDPVVVGVWMSILTLASALIHGLWLTLADPFLHWGNGRFAPVPAAMLLQALLATWGFPRLRRTVRGSCGFRPSSG